MASALEKLRVWLADSIRPKAHTTRGGYEGASHSRRTKNWNASRLPEDDLLLWSVLELRARSRHMVRNHWIGRRVMQVIAASVVGTGVLPSCREDSEFNALLGNLAKPQKQVGTNKGQSLASVQRLYLRTVATEGAALVVRHTRNMRQMRDRDLVLPFQLSVLSPDYLDHTKDTDRVEGREGHKIIAGIEYDATDWPVAYHIYKRHPFSAQSFSTPSNRIPSSMVSFGMWEEFAGQTIGIPWLTPALIKARDLDSLEDAQLLRQKIAAHFAGFIVSDDPDGEKVGMDEIALEPGRLQRLSPGESITFTDPPNIGDFADFANLNVRNVAVSVGMAYESLSGDFSNVNFSSARMSALIEKVLVEQWQQELMIGKLCQDLDRWIREGADLIGVTPGECRWTAPARPLIDPSREVGAILRKIEGGLSSRSHEVAKLGRSVEDVDAEREKDAQREAELDIPNEESSAVAQIFSGSHVGVVEYGRIVFELSEEIGLEPDDVDRALRSCESVRDALAFL